MLPVCIAPLRENTCPKISNQSAGCRARVMSSVKSWRSLRNSNSVMTNVFSMKPVKGWMKVAVIGLGLAKALGRSAFGGYVAEGAAGIESAADDVVEICCHGAPVVLRHAVERAVEAGARLAEPGEFTLRAFLRGRIDLPQAEAVRDLIEANTLYQAQVAAQQAAGSISRRLAPIKENLLELIALLRSRDEDG